MSQQDKSDDEAKHILGQFRLLGVTPKGDSPEQLHDWMVDYLKQVGKLSEEKPEVVPDTQTHNQTAVHVSTRVPSISIFSGSSTAKNENLEIWKYEVECLLSGHQYPVEAVAEAVRRSLKGEAASLVKRLGITASIPGIIRKLEGVFGNVVLTENLLAEFYSTRQKTDEDVARWSCRLEEILDQANAQKHIDVPEQREMLRNKLYSGLNDLLKSRCGHLFYTIKDYDELRINLRRVEQEIKNQDTGQTSQISISDGQQIKVVNQAVVSNKSQKPGIDIKDVHDKMAVLQEQNDILQKQLDEIRLNQQTCASTVPKGRGKTNHFSGQGEHGFYNQPTNHHNFPSTGFRNQNDHTGFSPHVQSGSGHTRQQPLYNNQTLNPQSQPWFPSNTPHHRYRTPILQCWRCGQFGHRQYRCTVILNKPLN